MTHRHTALAVMGTAFLIYGCVTASPATTPHQILHVQLEGGQTLELTRENEVTSFLVGASLPRVSRAMLPANADLGLSYSSTDEATHTSIYVHQGKSTLNGQHLSTFVDCGTTINGSRADTYFVTIKTGEVLEAKSDSSTALHLVVDAWAKPLGASGNSFPCSSTGELEKLLARSIVSQIR